jgi:hypothetical protein
MKVNSRSKGCRGELEACRAMEGITHLKWERTAQRWGNATADIWAPQAVALKAHFEVKFHSKGLKRFTVAATESDLNLTRDQLLFCRLDRWPKVLGSGRIPSLMNVVNGVSNFMRQAEEDAEQGAIPVVVMRQNECPWLVMWRAQDDQALDRMMLLHWKHHAA